MDGLYTMSGYYEMTGKMEMNSLLSGLRGPNDLVFKDGHHIRFGFPSYRLGGTVMGERSIELIGSCTFEDLTNNRKAVILMNTFKPGWVSGGTGIKDEVEGVIYDSKPLSGDKKSIRKNYCKDIEFVKDLDHISDRKKNLCSISGSWLKMLNIGGETYWSIDRHVPTRFRHTHGDAILPSDWRHREDLIWLKYGYMLIAHQWKVRLEVQ